MTKEARWKNPLARLSRGSRWGRIAAVLVTVAVIFGIAAAGFVYWAVHDVDLGTMTAEGPSIVLQAADGEPMALNGDQAGPYVTLDEMPDTLVQAVLTSEDRRFYEHGGLDYLGIARAALTNAMAGRVVQGGSTITQQLVKIEYLSRERTFKRKIREAVLASMMEMRLTKDQILERYLNSVYMGAGATGMGAAARTYFDKDVADLTLSESAMLAGIIRAPSAFNPISDLNAARERANQIVRAMQANGIVDEKQSIQAQIASAQLRPRRPETGQGSWFADWVSNQARNVAGAFRGTVTVRATLRPDLQQMALNAVNDVLSSGGKKTAGLQAALVAMDPSGRVVAMVGGRDYEESQYNRAVQAMRQPGSTFKLFDYYAALKAGYSPEDHIEDKPVDIDGYEPENYSGKYAGDVTLAYAFAHSLNAAAVNLAMKVGIDNVAAAARELGIEADLTETPSLALGSSGVSLLDMTEAYAAVRAGAAPIDATGISGFAMGDDGEFFDVKRNQPNPGDIAKYQDQLVRLLNGAVERGTGKNARLDGFTAGKTGTSQDYRDAWFIGFNGPLVTGVWVGHDDNSPMDKVTGGSVPAEIWHQFMQQATNALAGQPAKKPADKPESTPKPEPKQEQSPEPRQETPVAEADQEPVQSESVISVPADTQPRSLADSADILNPSGGSITRTVVRQVRQCNVQACDRFYRSFRASDCTYQPYGGGPRKFCDR